MVQYMAMKARMAEEMAQLGKLLPHKCEVSLIPSTPE